MAVLAMVDQKQVVDRRAVAVDVDLAHAQFLGDADLARAVGRPHARDEAVLGAVGDAHRIVFVVERNHHQHRAEDLLVGEFVVERHRPEQRRLDEETTLGRALVEPAFAQYRNAVLARTLQEPHDALVLDLADHRAAVEVGLVRPDAHGVHARGQCADHLVVDRALHQHAAAGRTGLAGVLDDGVDDDRQRLLEVSVLEHQLRRLAAQLEHTRHVVLGRRALDQRAHFG